jgi:hypothetical protein
MAKPILPFKRLSFEENQGKVIYQYEDGDTDRVEMDHLTSICHESPTRQEELYFPIAPPKAGHRDPSARIRLSLRRPYCRRRPEGQISSQTAGSGHNMVENLVPWVSKSIENSSLTSGQEKEIPTILKLLGSRENPFTGRAHILFAVPEPGRVTIRVYDMAGRLASELLNATVDAGYHSTVWDGRTHSGTHAASGVYFVRMETPGRVRTAKIVLTR